MKHERKELPLDEIEAGMVLADEVCDARGVTLLPKGASLTDAALNSLGRRGIETLPVLVKLALNDEERAANRAKLTQRLDRLFRLAGDNGAVLELKRQIGLYMQEHR